MKQVVLILPNISKKVDYRAIKNQIVSYVGTRMVDKDSAEEMPGLLLNSQLGVDDMNKLSEIMIEDNLGVLLFLSVDEEVLDGEYNYLFGTSTID